MAGISGERLNTPVAYLSYPKLFQKDEKGKFGAAFVFPTGTDLGPLKKAAFAVAVKKFGDEAKAATALKNGKFRLVGGPHFTIRTDVEGKYDQIEGGAVAYINSRGDRQPQIVDGQLQRITDQEKVHSGMLCRASVTPFWYSKDGNEGVAWGLNNIQIIRDSGVRFDTFKNAEDEFEIDPDAVADLSGLDDTSSQADEAPAPVKQPKKAAKAQPEADLAALLA